MSKDIYGDFYELSKLNTTALKSLCNKLGVEKGSKNDMIQNLSRLVQPQSRKRKRRRPQDHFSHTSSKKKQFSITPIKAAIFIQRWYRKRHWEYTNDTDFISLEIIRGPVFRLVEDQKNVYRFNPLNLAQYFIKEGQFVNPYTRRALFPVELMRLDRLVRTVDPTFNVNLFETYKQLSIQRAQEREHERTCNLLHNESLNILNDIVHLTEGSHIRMSNAMFELCNLVLPRYFHTFRQLYVLDYSFACDSILYVCQALSRMWDDATVANTRERCHIIETAQTSIVTFCHQLLPVFSLLIPDVTNRSGAFHDQTLR